MTPEEYGEIRTAIDAFDRAMGARHRLQGVIDFLMKHRRRELQIHVSGNSEWTCMPTEMKGDFLEWCITALKREQNKLIQQQAAIECPAGTAYEYTPPDEDVAGMLRTPE